MVMALRRRQTETPNSELVTIFTVSVTTWLRASEELSPLPVPSAAMCAKIRSR